MFRAVESSELIARNVIAKDNPNIGVCFDYRILPTEDNLEVD